jgi:hypothetical protein
LTNYLINVIINISNEREVNKMIIQVTLISNQGYKPVSTLVEVPSKQYIIDNKKKIQEDGIIKICNKRYWSNRELTQYGYTKTKMRVYDKEKIEQENKERYEKIKEERGWK